MIRKLVDVDRNCTKRVEAAKQKKLDVQKNLSQQRQEIYDSFIKEQQQKIDEHRKKLEKMNIEEENKLKAIYDTKLQNLENVYQENKETWITQIVERCLQ
ncbi:MAG: hypothetical protein ACK5LC_02455 [Coprobacillaceae bacterium]